MTEIVYRSQKGTPITSSLLVAEKFEKDHKNILRDIENLAAQNCAAKFFHKSAYENRGKSYPMFLMTRDGFSLLAMGFTGGKALQFKIAFIEKFNKMESTLKAQVFAIPQTLSEALMLAANQAKEIEAINKQLTVQAPKVELANRLIETSTRVDIGQAAKLLKLSFGRNIFFRELKDRGVFFKNRNEPKQEYIERGYFELFMTMIHTSQGDISVPKITVTQKGLAWLAKMFEANLISTLPKLNMI